MQISTGQSLLFQYIIFCVVHMFLRVTLITAISLVTSQRIINNNDNKAVSKQC